MGESSSCNRKARKKSDFRQDGQPAPPFSPPTPHERQGNSPTRNKSAAFAVPRAEGAAPSLVSSLPTLDLERDLPQCPRTEPGWKWARQTRALPMRPGQRRAEPDTGRFSELNGGPLFNSGTLYSWQHGRKKPAQRT